MDLSRLFFLLLLLLVAGGRLAELLHSKTNQRRLRRLGAAQEPEPGYHWMVLFHSSWLVASAAEVLVLHRPFLPWLAYPSLVLFAAALALRYWAIRTLGAHWNTQVFNSTTLGIVASGPYRYVRHPNYTAVYLEVLALPLVHTALVTAFFAALLHIPILLRRIQIEERMLMANPEYRAVMAAKPRLFPRRIA